MASMNTERASSSSSSTHQSTYDVFLSFRGEDTRNGFTSHLYTALDQKNIYTFIDDKKLERGKSISPTLMKAIKESRFAIVIFSKNYASSTWCLEELEEIIGCITKTGMTVFPIFYYVDPSDVRKQTGTFKQAFDEHEQRFKENIEKVQKWRAILEEVANMSGWHVPAKRSEAKCIQDIVKEILNKSSNTFSVPMELIGIESRVEKLKSRLAIESNDVRIIGIWGTGGMGKTTLARAVYEMFSNRFDAYCFIENVREKSEKYGLCKLQKKLLKKLLMLKNLNFQDVGEGVLMMKKMLQNKKILLVLDDVTELDQLKKLAGENCWFGSGSRVMITTRDKHLLELHEVKEIYEAEFLNHEEALHLFSLKALKMDHPPEDYGKLSQAFVDYCKGLPLALEVLGSFLFGKNIDEWENGLDRLNEFLDRRILNVLQISYNGLQSTEKEIFLYIACFYNHAYRDVVIKLLAYLGLYPIIDLRVLIDKSLVKLHGNQLWMHDLLQEMGRDIVRQECPKDPGKRSRLCSFEDIDKVLTKNTGTEEIQGIVLKLHEPKKVYWDPEAFSKMQCLKLLEIGGVQLMHGLKHLPNSLRILDWRGYPSKSLTSSFQSKIFENLKFLKLRESRELTEVPNISEVPNLETLDLQGCINLSRIDPSIGIHKKLNILNLEGCKNLTSLPSKFDMECLMELNLHGCSKIRKIPPSIGIHKKLTSLTLQGCKKLTSLPSKFEMECLTHLNLHGCSKITKIPEFSRNMKRVCGLYLGDTAITTLPTSIEHLAALRKLSLEGTAITTLPTSIEHLTDLVVLHLMNCKNLVHLPDTIFNLKLMTIVDVGGCSKLDRVPENLGNAESLEYLNLSGTAIRKVPSSIGLLKNLKHLYVGGSNKLKYEHLPFYSMPTSPLPMDLIFSSLSLSPASSLFHLDLRYCNLKAISNDIGSLFSLEHLDLSGNDFVCLPKSIILLSKLKWMGLNNCTSLRSLPKLPLNIESVGAKGCISLEMLPDPLKPSDSLEPDLSLHNCSKLADNQSCIDWFISGIRKYVMLCPSLPPEFLEKSNGITIPGSEIPEWFSHKSMGNEVEIKQPSHLYNEWMGTAAICIVFCAHVDFPPSFINFSLMGNGKRVSLCTFDFAVDEVSSDHLLLAHLTPQFFNEESHKLMWEGDVNGFSQFRIKMEIDNVGYDSWLKVKKWGFRMIYNKDMNVLHHNFDNSSVALECQKVKHSRDDYNGAGPSGEGSSNDIPNPERIKRRTETHGNSDSEESSEYEDCEEELSDRDESNDDLEEDNDDSDESSVDWGKYSESDLDD